MNRTTNSSPTSHESAAGATDSTRSPTVAVPLPPATPPLPTPQQTGRRVLVNTGALAGSSLWRIAISFVLQLLIARRLGVESLGQYTIALAYLNVCQIISELGLPALLVRDLAQRPWLRRAYFTLALRLQVAAAVATWVGLVLVTSLLPLPPSTRLLLWIIGASLPFYAVTSVCQMLFQSGEQMEYVMGVEFLINTLILGLSLFALLRGGNIWQLIAILVVTQLVSALLSWLLLRRSQLFAGEQRTVEWRWSLLWQQASPFYGLALADVLLQRADIVLLSIFGGEIITGIYGAAYNLLRVAIKLIQNFWAALYPTLSRLLRQQPNHYQRLASFGLRYTLLAGLAVAATGTGITSELLTLIYGSGYGEAAVVLQLLLWMIPLYLVENYTQTLLMVEQRPLQSLWITGLHLLALLILLPGLTTVQWVPAAIEQFSTAWLGLAVVADNSATWAAVAALLAAGIGTLSSIYLLQHWHLPGRMERMGPIVVITLLATFLGSYLPVAWVWRGLASISTFVLLAWLAGLFVLQDGQLLRRIFTRPKT